MDATASGRTREQDPFKAFNAVSGTDRDPYSMLAERRRETPVWRGSMIDPEVLPAELRNPNVFHLFRYDDCVQVLGDPATFTSAGYNETIGLVMGRSILGMEGAEHRTHRALIASAFQQKSLVRWEREVILPLCDAVIDRFIDDGAADLVQQLTFEVPVRVIAAILGLPEDDLEQFKRLSIELIGVSGDIERGLEASATLRDYFAEQVADRRQHPRQDLISDLASAEVDGEALDDEAIFAFLRLLLPAGAETTFRSSGNLLFLLLTHPDQMAAVREDRSLLPQAIEEGLRLEAPILSISRTATEDVEIRGVAIPAGAQVNPNLGSANHDELRWEASEEFDIFRRPQRHLAFAHGAHTCLGLHLARMETRAIVGRVLDRLGDVELLDDGDPHIAGRVFRSPTALPVSFTAA